MSAPITLDDPHTVPTRYWHGLDDGRVQCDVCPRACKLAEGQRGVCFVRGRAEDQIVLASYGRSSGFCIDPVEKKPLNHFRPGTPVLSFGTAGCNLACRFCQNWDISKSKEIDTLAAEASPERIAEVAAAQGCSAVAFTYNDPTIFLEYAVDTAVACHERGVETIAVTAGYINPEPRAEFFAHLDAANIDLKAFSEDFYRHTAMASLASVLETISYAVNETDTWIELTTLLIPGHNDSDSEVRAMCRWIVDELGPDVPLHFSAFHPDFKMTDVEATPPATLTRARSIARDVGVHHVYTGNVHDLAGGTTECTGCGSPVVVRDWYEIVDYRLDASGRCDRCGTELAGVFDPEPGRWGRRRQPVSMLGRSGS